MHFYKRFLGDYMRDTAHLSLTEHGAYTVLLDTMYATGKPLPADLDSLYRICRAGSSLERKAVDVVADQFFPIDGDGLRHNRRADREIEAHTEQAEINRAIAQNRSTNRQTNRETSRDTDRSPSHSQSHKKKQQGAFAPPDWVPIEAWNAYLEMRNRIRKPMTLMALGLAVGKLALLRDEGQDPKAVLEQSVFNSWQGLFPVHGGGPKKVAL